MELLYLKIKDTASYYMACSMQKKLFNLSFIFELRCSKFRVPGPKRYQSYLTIFILKVTFSCFFTPYMNMQKIISIHSFILEIQQLMEPRDQKADNHIWPYPPKSINIKVTFSFLKYVLAGKKSARLKLESYCLFLTT